MTQGISAQGTLIAMSIDPNWPDSAPQGGSLTWVTIAELTDIDPPELSRKRLETTNQNQLDDKYIVGIRRKGEMVFKLNWIPTDVTADALAAGLVYKFQQGSRDIYRITYPDGTTWIFSGFVAAFKPTAHLDTKLEAQVTIRPTGITAFSA